MPEELETNHELRKYLLGSIRTEEEKTVIEERLMTSDEYFQEFLIEEEELIQDYVDGHLTASEHNSFEKNYLISDKQRDKVKFAKALRTVLSPPETLTETTIADKKNDVSSFWQRLSARPLQTAFAGLAIVVLLSLSVWTYFRYFGNNEVLVALNKAYHKERPVESRITDLDYAQPKNVIRGNEARNFDKNEAELARTLAQKAVSDNPNATNLHTLGRVYLTERKFNDAIEQFNKAVELAPNNAKLHIDLGAAWFEKGKAANEKKLDYYGKAIEEFDKSISLDKNLAAAYFNKGLCLQMMSAPNQAKEAWDEYLKLDPNSQWADEVRRKLQELESNKTSFKTKDEMLTDFLAVFRQNNRQESWQMLRRNREMITSKLIPQQLAFSFSATKNKEYLDAFIYAGEVESKETGDSFWKDAAKFYQTLSEEKLNNIGKAHDLMKQGYDFNLHGNYQKSLDSFEAARRIFNENGDLWEANIATYWVGACQYILTDLGQSKKELQLLIDYCQPKSYRWLLAYGLFWTGVNYGSEKESSKAIDYYQKALKSSESVFDDYHSQKILSETAEEYRQVGRANLSLIYLEKSLNLSNYPEASLRQKSRTYDNLVRAFYTLKSYQTALVYEKETILLLAQIKDVAFHLSSNIQLGQILTAQKNYDEALKVFELSKGNAKAIENEKQKRENLARALLQIANLHRETGDCGNALESYTEAINFYNSGEFKAGQYDAHKGRLLCYLELKDEQNFDSELATVLDIFEKNRTQILDEQTRNIFFDNEQTVYDLAIDYEFGKGNKEKAFDYSEKSRSRSLLDLVKNGARVENIDSNLEVKLNNISEPLGLSELRQQMPDKVQLVQYTVLQDKVLIWLVSKNDFQAFSSSIKSEDLEEKVSSYLKLVSTADESATDERNRLSAELYKILITPVIDKTSPDKDICLIPDKILSQLPFASLRSLENKFLVEERSLFYAPSSNVFLVFTKNAEKLSKNSDETILSIGNPSFNQDEFPDLENLEPAEKEAKEIAKLYQQPGILLTKDALKAKVKEELSQKDVIHFAGHYVVNETSPLESSFILANNGQAEPNLANYELISQNLSHTRLVVLSACQTNAESYYHGEGMIGASRTFLAAGIPLVVASQWSVETNATADLMIKFHKYRTGGNLSTNHALRQAQLDLINQDGRYKNPYYWSAFITLGGYTEF